MIQKSNSSDLLSFDPFPLKGALIIRRDFEALSGRQEVEYFFFVVRDSFHSAPLRIHSDTSHDIHNNDKRK